MHLLEKSDGSVELIGQCPWQNCKDRFVIRWSPPEQKPAEVYMDGKYIGEGKLIIPPFKQLNGQMFLAIQRHVKEAHAQ